MPFSSPQIYIHVFHKSRTHESPNTRSGLHTSSWVTSMLSMPPYSELFHFNWSSVHAWRKRVHFQQCFVERYQNTYYFLNHQAKSNRYWVHVIYWESVQSARWCYGCRLRTFHSKWRAPKRLVLLGGSIFGQGQQRAESITVFSISASILYD